MSTCPTCSEEGVPGALFCGSCGSRLIPDPPPGEEVDPLVGKTINDTYAIERKIGSGGMGDVYRAIHNKLDAPVALKIVKPALLSHSAMVHRFEREARAASRLRHPNVVAVTDFGRSKDGLIFMVMEYVAGRSLAQVIADEAPIAEVRIVHIGAQILSALAEAHAAGILHRDLKPENVMIERRRDAPDSVKVLDFGIAKVLAAGASASTLTQAGLVCGTPGYMSPEQLRGGDVDPRSDLFSLGVVLYEMLTHKLPFDAHTPMDMLHRHLSEEIPPPGVRRGRPVSPDLERIVLSALAPAREQRPASADAMREALLHAQLVTPAEEGPRRPEATEVLPRGGTSRGPATARRATSARVAASSVRASPPSWRMRDGDDSGTAPLPQRTERLRTRLEAPRRGDSGPGATPTPTLQKRLEDRLAPLLGPVASRLVRRLTASPAPLPDICDQLAGYIPSESDRRSFLAWCAADLGTSGATRERRTALRAVTPIAEWDQDVLDRARRDLAPYVGPLARIIVRRVCTRARDARELYRLLALEIPGERDREAFLRLGPR